MGSIKSSSIDYNESNKSHSKSLAHIGSAKSLVELGVPKMNFFTFLVLLKRLLFHPKPWFPKTHHIRTEKGLYQFSFINFFKNSTQYVKFLVREFRHLEP